MLYAVGTQVRFKKNESPAPAVTRLYDVGTRIDFRAKAVPERRELLPERGRAIDIILPRFGASAAA